MELFDNKKKFSLKKNKAGIQEKMQNYIVSIFFNKNISISQKDKMNFVDSLFNLITS
jgi:hypothetical protein